MSVNAAFARVRPLSSLFCCTSCIPKHSMKRFFIVVSALAALSSGCSTELKSVRIVEAGKIPLAGAPYNLAYTRFKVKVIRRVASCFKPPVPGGPANAEPEITVKVQATALAEQQRDPMRNYVLDLKSLQGAFKSTDVQVAYYDTGAIKSINASAEDKTGEVLASVVQTAAKLVVGAVPASDNKLFELKMFPVAQCESKVDAAVKALPGLEAELTASAAKIAAKAEEIKQYLTVAVSLGRSLPRADREAVTKRVRELIALQGASAAIQAKIENHLALISVVNEFTWPANGETFVSATPLVKPVDAAVLKRWMGTAADSARPGFVADTAVYLELKASENIGRVTPCTKHCPDDQIDGLKYRMPAVGNLLMCATLTAAQACSKGQVVAKEQMISQLGPVYTLPLKSAVFTNKSIVATFSENGVPTLLGTTASAAAGKAAATFGSLADASIAVHASRAGREAAELESKIKVLTLKKELEVATLALAPAPKDAKKDAAEAFTVDTALLNAELANIAAKNALDEARQRLPSD